MAGRWASGCGVKNEAGEGTKFPRRICTCMSEQQAHVLPFRHPRAPQCEKCQLRTTLSRLQLDPNGGRYMFETFECRLCATRQGNVRAIQPRGQSQPEPIVRPFASKAS